MALNGSGAKTGSLGSAASARCISPVRVPMSRAFSGKIPPINSSSSGPGAAAAREPQPGPRRSRAFDASEGTALDPLRDRSYDLNSAKTVPAMLSAPLGRIPPAR